MKHRSMRKNVLRVFLVLSVLFVLMLIHLVYLQAWEAKELVKNPKNQRERQWNDEILRGNILSSEGVVLATSEELGKRSYPLGEEAAFATGYWGKQIGSVGLENLMNRALLGMSDEVGAMGPLRQLFQATRGNDVKLTIHEKAQRVAYQELDGKKGAVVVLDVDTGAVLALVSAPSFDPNSVEEKWHILTKREDAPLLNRPLQGHYPPGSTLKPMILDGALEANLTSPDEVFDVPEALDVGGGNFIKESHGALGKINLEQALTESSNVVFGTLGIRLGKDGLRAVFERFGFQREITGDLEGISAHLPNFNELGKGDIAQIGIGQSSLLVTPMQMALLAEAFARDGRVMKPYFVEQVLSPSGVILEEHRPEEWFRATTPDRAELIDQYMEQVVLQGTGKAARVKNVRVTGKTGTAENPQGKDHAWFIGSAQLADKKIAFAILVENSGSGGLEAAPIAARLIRSLRE